MAGVGTGGTITGVSRYIKNTRGKKIISVAVEPKESPVITQHLAGLPIQPAPHKIQGIGAGFVPKILDTSAIDEVLRISNETAFAVARKVAKLEGIAVGISSGAALAAAIEVGGRPGMAGKTIVVILPDFADRYLSTALFDGLG